jgi:YgiT-type zinc finger domain-containing protein
MMNDWQKPLVEKRVTYTLELNGKFILVENVPARVNEETGEQFFSPSTVEHLQQLILDKKQPYRVVEIPVYSYVL